MPNLNDGSKLPTTQRSHHEFPRRLFHETPMSSSVAYPDVRRGRGRLAQVLGSCEWLLESEQLESF